MSTLTDTKLSRTCLSYVALRTADVARAAQFYSDVMGLRASNAGAEVSAGGEGGDGKPEAQGMRLGWGAGQYALELLPGATALDHFGLEVGDTGGHHALGERLRRAGIKVEQRDPAAETLVVHDPDGNVVHIHGPVSRAGEHSADPGRRPVRIQHVTLATADIDPMIDFYLKLGFRLTDRMGGVFAWLRSDVQHHSVAVVRTGTAGLDHFSFDLDSWADFRVWADRLTDRGVPVQWGPGRHGPGNNLFLFFDDPDGNHIELSAEMERFFDDRADYPTRTWTAEPKTVNLWGGQLPAWRQTTDRQAS